MNTNDLHELFARPIVQIFFTVAIAVIAQIIVRESIHHIVGGIIRGHLHTSKQEELQRERTLTDIFRRVSAGAIWLIAIIVVLYQLHINVAALLTGAGLVGILVGFGAQNAIKDYLAGIFILAENQYRVGDVVTLYAGGANISGAVEEITLRITRLRDMDGNLHIVPNGSGGVVTNRSFSFANVNIDVAISYDSDIEQVRDVINAVGVAQSSDEELGRQVLEPVQFLRVDGFTDAGVLLKAVGRVRPAQQWAVAGDFRLRLKKAFDEAGITIPLPQVVVHQAKK